MQRVTSKNWLSWLQTTATNLQMQVTNINTDSINPNVSSVIQTHTTAASDNPFITTREAQQLANQVDCTSDVISVGAIGGNTAYFLAKRIIDVVTVIIMIMLLLPVLIVCAVWVAIENGGSTISKKQEFTSKLVKRDGRYMWIVMPFTCYEFLTTETASGKFLEATGMNALPALLNVVRGEMSIIGAETLTQEDIEVFEEWQFLGFACKPGIIGLSRISGKLSWLANDRTRQEVWYACNQSLSVDFKILLKALQSIIAI